MTGIEEYDENYKPITEVIKENLKKAKDLSLTLEELQQDVLSRLSRTKKVNYDVNNQLSYGFTAKKIVFKCTKDWI